MQKSTILYLNKSTFHKSLQFTTIETSSKYQNHSQGYVWKIWIVDLFYSQPITQIVVKIVTL
jgi:hypothetical protein